MQEQYFASDPTSKHDLRKCEFVYKNNKLAFLTDSGVFSKGAIDKGSEILLSTIKNIYGNVLDMGCGYGVVGIALKSAFKDIDVYASDINLRAVELTILNAQQNNVQINVSQGNGLENLSEIKFDFCLINPPIRAGKALVYDLFKQIRISLNINGKMIVVIRTKQGAKSAVSYLKTLFNVVNTIKIDSGYRVLECLIGGDNY